jgi:hypothetical protein
MSEIGRDSPNGAALFEAANKLRGSVESAEYKHLVLGLLFLKYISDAFEQRRGELEAELTENCSDQHLGGVDAGLIAVASASASPRCNPRPAPLRRGATEPRQGSRSDSIRVGSNHVRNARPAACVPVRQPV